MKPTLVVAVAQTMPRRGDVDANIEEHLRLAGAAAEHGAHFLVFPELSLTGYELDLAEKLAFSEHDPRLAPLAGAASAHAMTLVAGAPVRLGTTLHIGALIVSGDGSVEVYTKQHLGAFPAGVNPGGDVPPAEWTVFAPGDRNPLVRINGIDAAVAVCADTSRPGHAEQAAGRGARIYLASMFFTPPELEAERARLRSYAVRHSITVALANYGGPSGGLDTGGGSAIWSATGDLLAQVEGTGSGIAVAAVEDAPGSD